MEDSEQEEANRHKLQHLADRIQQMTNSSEKLKDSQRQSFESQLRSLEYKISKDFNGSEYESQLSSLKHEAHKLKQNIHNEELAADAKHSNDLSNVKQLDDIIQCWVAEQKLAAEQQTRFLRESHNEELNHICQQTKDSMIESQAKYEQTYEDLSRDIRSLKEGADKEKTLREDTAGSIALTIGKQLDRFKQAVAQEINQRKDSEERIKSQLQDVRTKLKAEIQRQKNKREYMGRSLLSLIEAACEKLERKLLK